jgi:membrane protein
LPVVSSPVDSANANSAAGSAAPGSNPEAEPDAPTELPKASWFGVLKRTLKEFKNDNISDWAAALTYRAVMAMAPGILVLVSALGLLGKSTTNKLLTNVGQLAPGGVHSVLKTMISNTQGKAGTASVAAIVGIVLALYSASGYVAAFMRASNAIYEVGEGRPVWKTIPVRLAVTIAIVILIMISAVIVVFTGPIADKVGSAIGVGHTAVVVWDIAKWPVLIIIVSLMLAILYYACPNVKQPGFVWVSPGGVLGVLIWVIASALFAFYVANFGSYNKTYGALASVIIFLIWLWITNVAILIGAEFNAEMQHARAIEAGESSENEPFAEPRDTRKLDDDAQAKATALSEK